MLVEASPGPPAVVVDISANTLSRKIISIITTTAIERARCGSTRKRNCWNQVAPSMRAASSCSRFMPCSEVMKMRMANGSHCQATMMITDSSGQSLSQSIGVSPTARHTCASTP